MSEELKNDLFVLDGQEISLSALAGVELDDVDEVRGSQFPAGHFKFQIVSDPLPELTTVDVTDRETQQQVKRAVVKISSKCLDIINIKPQQPDGSASPAPQDIIGKIYTETFFLRKQEDIGRVKAFLVDVGLAGKGAFKQLLLDSVGATYSAPITHTKNKNNTDQVYVNMDRRKVVAIQAAG